MNNLQSFVLDSVNSGFDIAIVNLVVTLLAFMTLWLINVFVRDVGVVDFYWAPGFAVIIWLSLYLAHGALDVQITWQRLLLGLAITVWAVRLVGQLIWRHAASSEEDARYRAMRDAGGASFWWVSLFTIFVLQAIIMWLVSTPLQLAMMTTSPAPSDLLFAIGLLIAFSGFAIESIADWQLFHGKKSIKPTQTYRGGLWGYSRHPNYLGELICWAGFGLAAYAISGSPWVFAGPVFLATAILGASLPLTEKHMISSRSDYPDYMAITGKLLPLRTRKPGQTGKSGNRNQIDPAE